MKKWIVLSDGTRLKWTVTQDGFEPEKRWKRERKYIHTQLSLSLSLSSLVHLHNLPSLAHPLLHTRKAESSSLLWFYSSVLPSTVQVHLCNWIRGKKKEQRGWSESRKEKFACIWSNSLFVSPRTLLLFPTWSDLSILSLLLSYAFFPPLFNLRKICLSFHPSLHSHPHLTCVLLLHFASPAHSKKGGKINHWHGLAVNQRRKEREGKSRAHIFYFEGKLKKQSLAAVERTRNFSSFPFTFGRIDEPSLALSSPLSPSLPHSQLQFVCLQFTRTH